MIPISIYNIATSTPVGDFHIIFDRRQKGKKVLDIAVASGFGSLRTLRARLPEEYSTCPTQTLKAHPYIDLVKRYFSGDKRALARIDYEQQGGDFFCHVWEQMAQIPFGQTCSYSELAALSGSPLAVRAVGSACARNALVLLVPCHRVIKNDGSLGNYAYGVRVKQYLLDHEQQSRVGTLDK